MQEEPTKTPNNSAPSGEELAPDLAHIGGIKQLWPVDWAHAIFLSFSCVLLILFREESPQALTWVAVNSGLLLLLSALIWATPRLGFQRAAAWRMSYALLAIPLVFTQLGALVPYVNPAAWEQRLYDFDLWVFRGTNPLEYLEAWSHPLLTEILQWVYNYYYFIAVILGVAVFKKQRALELARMMFVFVLCIYLSYVGYYIVPVTGPNIDKLGLYNFRGDLPGLVMSMELRETMSMIEKIKQDCFPSGHTAVSLVALLLAMRFVPKLTKWLSPLVAALIFSTMYLRYHYFADVLGGIILAVLSFYLGLYCHRGFERRIWGAHGHKS